jgi:PhnB protein
VEDVDATVRLAEAAGATVQQEPTNEFWGDRLARLKDPFGHLWEVASRVEDLTPEEIAERAKARFTATARSQPDD